jgi:hypothetical protein
MSCKLGRDNLLKTDIQMQIYKSILDFRNRSENPYGYKVSYSFRYNSYTPSLAILNTKPPTQRLWLYVMANLFRYNLTDTSDIDDIIFKSMTVNLNPNAVGIARQNIKMYIDELVELNLIAKAGERGYEYYVNPYYYNVLSSKLAHHCFTQMQQLLLLKLLQ